MTAVLDLRHATSAKHRESIMTQGLLPHTPGIDGNYPFFKNEQPRGVYMFSRHITEWGGWDRQHDNDDLWRIAYFGPLRRDQLIDNAVIAPDVIEPCRLYLMDPDDPSDAPPY